MQISASQLKTYGLCPKKWYFEKVEKLPRGKTSYGATFGSALHACLERIQLGEDPFPEGWDSTLQEGDDKLAKDLLALYRKDEEVLPENVEREIRLPVIDDINLLGYIDLYKPGKIVDHKTTKAMRWALSAKELAKDLQMLVYAKWALDQEGPEIDAIELRHNVFLRTAPVRHKKTVAFATREAIMERWYQVQETALLMKQAREKGSPPGTEMGDQCHAYGGCPYARICSGVMTSDEFRGEEEIEMPRRKKETEIEPTERKVVLYIGCFPTRREAAGVYLSLDAVFEQVLKVRGQSLSDYANSNAFDRRDSVAGDLGAWLKIHDGPVHVTAPSVQGQVPDEKNLVWALRQYARAIIEASA